jgi:ABC-2 type transport system ATP-binding protein
MAAIEIENVTKRFGDFTAVNNVSLSVPEGSIYGFIGPNGSGKTTTLRMIMNILLPDTGNVAVFGQHSSATARDNVGYLPEERGLYKKMEVRRLLRYYGQLKGKSLKEIDPVINTWLERFQLTAWANKKIEALSKGMAQKTQFISAIVSSPKLLILDEPFSGLDPVNADALKDAVLDLRKQGTTIVFSTHDMGAAERMCDRIFMIFKGNKVLDGTLDEIQSKYGHDTVRVKVPGGRTTLAGLGRDADIESMNDFGNYQELRLKSDPQKFLQALVQKTAVEHFEITRPSLHDIFVRIANPTAEDLKRPVSGAD